MRSLPPTEARRLASRLVVLGDLVLDVVVAPKAPLVIGSDTPGTIRFRAGGSAANTARAFAALGGRATFIGSVGADAAGRELNAALRGEGVTARTVVHRAPTARLVVQLDASGERTFITERGAADLLSPDDLDAAWFTRAAGLHLPLYSLLSEPLGSAARRAAGLVRSAGSTRGARGARGAGLVSVDLASVGPIQSVGVRAAGRLVASVAPDVLFANAAEASLFGATAWPDRLLELAPVVVVKQGVGGCEVLVRVAGGAARGFTVATRPLVVADTTGAGDAFDAGFLMSVLGARAAAGEVPAEFTARQLRSAAVAGNRAASKLLTSRRADLGW